MKIQSLLFAVAALVGGLAFTTPASAAVVDFTGPSVTMTPAPLAIGQSGTISADYASNFITSSFASGVLSSHSMIKFTYSLPSTMNNLLYTDSVGYNYTLNGHHYVGSYTDLALDLNNTGSYYTATVDGVPSVPLVFASAQMTSAVSGMTIIKNFSAGLANFSTQMLAFGAGLVSIHYEVSAIPLPAALPMFGLGLLALAGVRKARKTAKQ